MQFVIDLIIVIVCTRLFVLSYDMMFYDISTIEMIFLSTTMFCLLIDRLYTSLERFRREHYFERIINDIKFFQ
ncbi:hypothetical protein Catovirus_1_363 [Catovirus CTV1]|uniref:Uncharacterized protein n=1 Tax=Catovirus CTV1 TaxID=1977631 RepID=A0A1V0S9D9_9VIRU|nr:hypothetical protein Catovirus_1_363 [Catovirus CTV1]